MPDRRPSTLAAFLLAACASPVFAAADDINTPTTTDATAPAPAVPSTGQALAALGRRVVDGVIATGAGVVDALAGGSAPNWSAPTWRLGSAPRPATLAARAAVVADAAGRPIQAQGGVADFSMGARWHVLQGDADTHVPVVSWMADVQPASAAALSGSSVVRPSVHLSAEWALPGDWSLGVMPGVAVDLDNQGRRYASGTMAVTVGHEWIPGVRGFVDFARDRMTLEQGAGTATTVDAGLTIVTGPSTQLDLAVARGLSASAPPVQAGVGVSSTF